MESRQECSLEPVLGKSFLHYYSFILITLCKAETMKVYSKINIIKIQYLQATNKWHHNACLSHAGRSFQYNFLWINFTMNFWKISTNNLFPFNDIHSYSAITYSSHEFDTTTIDLENSGVWFEAGRVFIISFFIKDLFYQSLIYCQQLTFFHLFLFDKWCNIYKFLYPFCFC